MPRKKASRFTFFVRCCIAATGIIAFSATPGLGQDQQPSRKDRRLPVSVNWVDAPLRDRLQQLSQTQRIPIFLDRRINPNQEITFAAKDVTIEQLLWRLAAELNVSVCKVDNLYYFGPQETTDALPLLLEELRVDIKKRLGRDRLIQAKKNRRLQWGELTEPREIANRGHQGRSLWKFENPEEIPHDLWPEFGPVSVSMDLSQALIVFGFDKWIEPFKTNSGSIKLKTIELPHIDSGQLEIRDVENGATLLKEARAKFPDCKIVRNGKTFLLTGSPAATAAVRRFLVEAQQPIQTGEDQARFDLKTTASRKAILQRVAQQLGVALNMPDDAILNERVAIDLKQVSLEELIVEVLNGSGYRHQRSTSELTIIK